MEGCVTVVSRTKYLHQWLLVNTTSWMHGTLALHQFNALNIHIVGYHGYEVKSLPTLTSIQCNNGILHIDARDAQLELQLGLEPELEGLSAPLLLTKGSRCLDLAQIDCYQPHALEQLSIPASPCTPSTQSQRSTK